MPSINIGSNGTPSIGSLLSIIEGLGFGGGAQPTFALFTKEFQNASVSASVNNVTAAKLVGGNSYSFTSTSNQSCREQALDKPGTSISDYRISVYISNIMGWM